MHTNYHMQSVKQMKIRVQNWIKAEFFIIFYTVILHNFYLTFHGNCSSTWLHDTNNKNNNKTKGNQQKLP